MKRKVLVFLLAVSLCLSLTACTVIEGMLLLLPTAAAAPAGNTPKLSGIEAVKIKDNINLRAQRKQLSARVRSIPGYGKYVLPDVFKKSEYSDETVSIYYTGALDIPDVWAFSCVKVFPDVTDFSLEEYEILRDDILDSWWAANSDNQNVEMYWGEPVTSAGYPCVTVRIIDTAMQTELYTCYVLRDYGYVAFFSARYQEDEDFMDPLFTMINSFRWE